MRSRVMPGSLVTMERRVPVRRLKSVDLPTLGRPTITIDGSLEVIERHAARQANYSIISRVIYVYLQACRTALCIANFESVANFFCKDRVYGNARRARVCGQENA
jgi:hypothetical protein